MAEKRKKNAEHKTPGISGQGILYVVATPIGNLEDITLRAIRILREVDLIAAEDTRHTRKLLTHLGIITPTISYYKDKEKEKTEIIIKKLLQGTDVALVADAGTPGISDPGSILVQKAISENIRVIPIPGPSSLTAALSVSGLPDNSFIFLGFAPSRKKQRQDLLESLVSEKKALVFFEAPHRLESFLHDCFAILGDRNILWCRELTKMHEELTWNSLGSLVAELDDRTIKGESVLVISGAEKEPEKTDTEITSLLRELRATGTLSLKDAVQLTAKRHNLSRSAVYRLALEIWK